MNVNIRRFFIKNTIVLGFVYSSFFIVFNSFINIDLNLMKTVFSAFLFAIIMTSYTCSSELKNYKRLLKGEIALHDMIPSAEGTMKMISLLSIDKVRQIIKDAGFVEGECYGDYITFTTHRTWLNSVPISIFIVAKEGMLNIKIYKFTRRNFIEPQNAKDILSDIKSAINSCS